MVWRVFRCRMSLDDFVEHFCIIQICNLSRDSVAQKRYHLTQYHGSWEKGLNAGGNCAFPGLKLISLHR